MGYWDRLGKGLGTVLDPFGSDSREAVGEVYNDITGVTTAREIGSAQKDALGRAIGAQEQGYQRSVDQLSPYAETGGQFLEGLSEGVQSGAFDPGAFDYQGQQPGNFNYRGPGQQGGSEYQGDPNITSGYRGQQQGALDHQGQQQGASGYRGQQQGGFSYDNGQQSQNAYRGGPEMGSIQSFMGDPSQDPGYQFRMDQGLKAVDRAAAAGGRFGGGQTAKELNRFAQGTAAQGYADDFARAGQEREAQRFGEQATYGRGMADMQSRNQAENIGYGRDLNALNLANQAEASAYGRSETGLDRRNLAEQSAYGRNLDALTLANQAEQSAYGRAENKANIGRQIEANQYGRSETGLNRVNQAEQERYNRDLQAHGLYTGREQEHFNRERQGYTDQAQRVQDDYNRQVGMTNMGMNAGTMMSNAALGQGSALSNLAVQQGNANAAQIAAEGTTSGNLLNLIGAGIDTAGSAGQAYSAWKGGGK